MPRSFQPQEAQAGKDVVSVPWGSEVLSFQASLYFRLSMNAWTRHLFDHLTAVEDSTKKGEGRSDFLMLEQANEATPTAENYEAWKLDVLDLLFMAPGVGRSALPKPEPYQQAAFMPRCRTRHKRIQRQ